MKILLIVKKERNINIDKKTPLAFLISFVYMVFIGILSFERFATFYHILLFGLSIIFYALFQAMSFILSGKYVILDGLYNGRYMGIISAIIHSFFIVFTTYILVFYYSKI